MALQTSGQISLSDIMGEIPSLINNVSLYTLSTGNINIQSPSRPDGSAPHAMSEFFGYDHAYSPGTLIPGTGIVVATKFYWPDLCYSVTNETWLLNTPKMAVGTLVKNSNGTSISTTSLPGYIGLADGKVAQIETNGICSLINDCETVGDPGGGGIGLEPAPGEGDGDDLGPGLPTKR